jgi:CopG family nickel-responsive transcriptional regulator
VEAPELKDELSRIGVSLPHGLLEKFDRVMNERGYTSRSEGIRDAIRNYIADFEWMAHPEAQMLGVLTLLYNHHQRGLKDSLGELQHKHPKAIESSLHIHLTEDLCLEVVLIRGDSSTIKSIAESMISMRGMLQAKLSTVSSAEF